MRHALFALLTVSIAGLSAGCGGGGESTVTGTVSFDGKPIEKGSVTFVGTAPGGARAGAVVAGGQFQVKLAPGTYKVEVSATKAAGTRKQKGFDGKDEVIELTEELIPDYYNVKTELTEEIKSGANAMKLELRKK